CGYQSGHSSGALRREGSWLAGRLRPVCAGVGQDAVTGQKVSTGVADLREAEPRGAVVHVGNADGAGGAVDLADRLDLELPVALRAEDDWHNVDELGAEEICLADGGQLEVARRDEVVHRPQELLETVVDSRATVDDADSAVIDVVDGNG